MSVVYVTRYAMSGVISMHDVAIRPDGYAVGRSVNGSHLFLSERDYYGSFEEALADANARRVKKIASLEKQIEKLRKIDFEARFNAAQHAKAEGRS